MESLGERMGHLDLQEPDVFDNEESVFHQEPADEDPAEEAAGDSPDDMTCAICLERTPLTDIALVKGCDHQHCVHCILEWAMHKEWCPQCKKPFDYLLTHRQLDGTLTDYLTEESVVLLKRACWFVDHMRAKEQARAAAMPILASGGASSSGRGYATAGDAQEGEARDWADFYEDYVDAELDEDEEIEQYYFSSAAGRARVVLGNRRWGEGGYMRAGRMYARPVQHNARTTPNAAGGKTAGKAAASKAAAPAGSSPGASSSRAAAGSSGAGSSSSAAAGASSGAGSSGAGTSGTGSGGAGSGGAGNSGAGNSGAGGSGSSSGGGAGSNRGRSSVAAAAASSSSVRSWWNDDDDDDDFDYDEDFPCIGGGGGGGGGGSSSSGNRHGSSSGSRSRSRPDRPSGMIKPIRQVPKNSPVCSMAAVPLVSPLGKSPGGGGFCVGSWGASGSGSGPAAAGGVQMGSTPGSGRRAKRNARRAAVDVGGDDGEEWD